MLLCRRLRSHLRAHVDLFLELNLLRSTIVHNNAMQYKGQHPPLLPKMPFCLLYLPPKLVCIHKNFLHRVYTNLNSSFLDPSFLEWRLGCKTCIVYTGLKSVWRQSMHGLSPLTFMVYMLVVINRARVHQSVQA